MHADAEGAPSVLRGRTQLRQQVRYDNYAMLAYDEPMTYVNAMQSCDRDKWQAATNDEMMSLLQNGTWNLVERPDGRAVIKNRRVYKVKNTADGFIDRHKARLVAQGYSKQAGIENTETFSPIARFDTAQALLNVTAAEQLNLCQFDTKTAFLYGTNYEVIYMQQPEGFKDGTDRICVLKKSLYGLEQSLRCWNATFKAFLNKHGLTQSTADSCLYYSK